MIIVEWKRKNQIQKNLLFEALYLFLFSLQNLRFPKEIRNSESFKIVPLKKKTFLFVQIIGKICDKFLVVFKIERNSKFRKIFGKITALFMHIRLYVLVWFCNRKTQ